MLMADRSFSAKLQRMRQSVGERITALDAPYPRHVLFLSVSDGDRRARVVEAGGDTFDEVWAKASALMADVMAKDEIAGRWLRADWVEEVQPTTWRALKGLLTNIKRNYFRYGLALDPAFNTAFLEQELNANAMLYSGGVIPHCVVNEKNFGIYVSQKYPELPSVNISDDAEVFVLSTRGRFCAEAGEVLELNPSGLDAGRRQIKKLGDDDLLGLIGRSSTYLAGEVLEDGRFIYGYHPCFDRRINAYNTLRHASTTYAMVEAWAVTRDAQLGAAIERSLGCITRDLVREKLLPDGTVAAFLVEDNGEVKLGGNAVTILALTKYSSVTETRHLLPLAEKLAAGIRFMQDEATGTFVHVLNFEDLTVKDAFRTIYYDGEAAFGLMRLYDLTRDPALLASIERAFEHFIAAEHWRHHDHWLSYCVNELTRYRADERYFRFGIANVATYLDFVSERITTFPTLLELMMAAERMIRRIGESDDLRHLLAEIDLPKFYRALHKRAHYLLNGYFWPEMAMFFRNPNRIVGSFFIRHHAFRVRIDDVEHYLSGLVAYRAFLLAGGEGDLISFEVPRQTADPSAFCMLMRPTSPKGFVEVETLAKKAAARGLKPLYASYVDADAGRGFFNGYAYVDGAWVRTRFPIPTIIDNAPPKTGADRALLARLENQAFVACQRLGGKHTLALLEKDERPARWLIPSSPASEAAICAMLERDGAAILKPYRSNRGRSIKLLTRLPDGLTEMRCDDSRDVLDADGLSAFAAAHDGARWLLQRYVPSNDPEGLPFDIRVPLFRSTGGEWRAAQIYARRGVAGIASNLARGGSAIDAAAFLRTLYGDRAPDILETLRHAAFDIAAALQDNYPFLIDALGLDFGFVDGQPALFEVNGYPGIKGCLDSATDLKADYIAAISSSVAARQEPRNNRAFHFDQDRSLPPPILVEVACQESGAARG